jgi:hypothetical protein
VAITVAPGEDARVASRDARGRDRRLAWEAPHPDWTGAENEALRRRLAAISETPNEAASGMVSSYAIDEGERLLLFDPLAVPSEIEELAAGREFVVRRVSRVRPRPAIRGVGARLTRA